MKILFSEKLNKSKGVCLKQEQKSVIGGCVEVLLIKYIYIKRTYWYIGPVPNGTLNPRGLPLSPHFFLLT